MSHENKREALDRVESGEAELIEHHPQIKVRIITRKLYSDEKRVVSGRIMEGVHRKNFNSPNIRVLQGEQKISETYTTTSPARRMRPPIGAQDAMPIRIKRPRAQDEPKVACFRCDYCPGMVLWDMVRGGWHCIRCDKEAQ